MTHNASFRVRLIGIMVLMSCGWAMEGGAQLPVDAESRFNLGVGHLREGRLDLAIEQFQLAVKQDPKNAFFLKGLGLAYAQQGKLKEAIETLRKALEFNPSYSDLRNDLGAVLIKAGKREEGKREFQSVLNDPMNPTPEISSRNLGQAYLEEKNCNEAQAWFRASVEKNRTYVDAHLGLADALICLGQLDNAIIQLEAAVTNTSENPDALVALGDALFKAGRFGEARTRLEAATKKDPAGPAGRRATEMLKSFPK
jgi:Tfp pilus assembly protein PilF